MSLAFSAYILFPPNIASAIHASQPIPAGLHLIINNRHGRISCGIRVT